MNIKDPLFDKLLVEDDASRYLDSLSSKDRRPQYVKNKLPKSGRSFTKAERNLAKLSYSPHLRPKAS